MNKLFWKRRLKKKVRASSSYSWKNSSVYKIKRGSSMRRIMRKIDVSVTEGGITTFTLSRNTHIHTHRHTHTQG